jgi:hypothetical protein
MSSIKPLVMSFSSLDELEKAKADYDFIGREVDVDRKSLRLTVLTIPRKYKKKADKEAKLRARKESDNYDDYNN